MKKFKKIICLALAMVMMMAMSTVAFAEESATVTINGLKDGATVNIYTVATIDENNTVVKQAWAKDAYTVEYSDANAVDVTTIEMTSTQVSALKSAFETAKPSAAKPEQTASKKSVSFTGLEAGVYYIVATSKDATYSPMVAVAISRDDKGNYVAASKEITAKGTNSDLKKEANDQFVHAGEEVTFTITKSIPSYANKFVIYDYTTNLSSLDGVSATVKYANTEKEYKFKATATANKFALDLTDIVYDEKNDAFINDNVGDTLTITYKATVTSPDNYVNEVTYSTNDNDETGTYRVEGFEGDITLTKTGTDGKKLKGAKFTLTKKGSAATETAPATEDKVLTFTFDETKNAYVYDETSQNTELVTDEEGIIKVVGLDEGTYQFTEKEAPAGYSINENIEAKTITPAEASVSETVSVVDSTLIKLPFTGGMGTTMFTVLGVAIMAIASALYFASKKTAKN
ncbi:SpaA isopeptide-forming pilin-related protein [Pseudobutyrivibrio sp. MD2005]|uniref:SpaA isopeptide-forming pilin-related protein n=1 Tax=Pseudobutyrivibrio sp. MD2005 TaxID=1410616 RepID=UPI0004845E65|nr:SpaA isopeptide-forming pilin-related protein [Pseudobutyrivibrio sp. MD2005]